MSASHIFLSLSTSLNHFRNFPPSPWGGCVREDVRPWSPSKGGHGTPAPFTSSRARRARPVRHIFHKGTVSMRTSLRVSLASAITLVLASAPAFAQPIERVWTRGMASNEQYSSFIVKYRDGSSKRVSADTAQDALKKRLGVQQRSKRSIGSAPPAAASVTHQRRMGGGADVVTTDKPLDRPEAEILMQRIADDPDVEYVQPNYMMSAFATPNDPRYGEQWHYSNPTSGARLPGAWDRSTGQGVVVAVVDSGYLNNNDLQANLLPGYDMISSTRPFSDWQCIIGGMNPGCGGSDDGDGRDADAFDASGIAHGTHVAGTVAAVTNNQIGVAGVAYNAKVVPVRVLGNQGNGGSADIIDGMLWSAGINVPNVPANANPAEVINLSLGGRRACSPAEQDAIDDITAQGTIVVVAAGNSNLDVSEFAPANCKGVIAVAANDQGGRRAFYSNYGAGIHITAPGGETWSCRASVGEFLPLATPPSQANCAPTRQHPAQGILSTVGNNAFDFMSGTSMAAPHVAGIVALMQAVAPVPKTTDQVKDILRRTAHPIAAANCPGGCGPGIVDAAEAVKAASN
ncbi:hypothetical protein SMRA8_1988 [Stenotrophomonas maltophilia RA8]|nr:hypothetical protein SMRA8_1988 [Stenotrophomonas maltophilia RA8]